MKTIVALLIFITFRAFTQQNYINLHLSDGTFKSSHISLLNKITLSTNFEQINFVLTDGTTAVENVADIINMTLDPSALGQPLPVELSFFTAYVSGSNVILNWRTETEINNFGFDVERSSGLVIAGSSWDKIGFVEGNGNSNSPKVYSFIDNDVSCCKYYYRLKQIDSDGQSEYSNVIYIDLDIPDRYSLFQNFPNPFNPSTNISYYLPNDGIVALKVYDILGNEVKTLVNDIQKSGKYTITFNSDNLSSGVYFCNIYTPTYSSTIKMILMR